jgi:signal recognition particle receptor subunit beta
MAGNGHAPGDDGEESGEGVGAGDDDVLVFTASSMCPELAWRRLAGESSAWVLLANANDPDSLRATRVDLEFVQALRGAPYVVATYVSMADEELSSRQIHRLLGLDAKTPVIACQLRDRESVAGVVRAALELAAEHDAR